MFLSNHILSFRGHVNHMTYSSLRTGYSHYINVCMLAQILQDHIVTKPFAVGYSDIKIYCTQSAYLPHSVSVLEYSTDNFTYHKV